MNCLGSFRTPVAVILWYINCKSITNEHCSKEYIFTHTQWPLPVRQNTAGQVVHCSVCLQKRWCSTSLTLCYWPKFFLFLRLEVKGNICGLVFNLVQLLEFFLIVCNFVQLMEQFTLQLVPTWRLNVLLLVDVLWETQKLQEDIACLQNVSFNTFMNVKSVGYIFALCLTIKALEIAASCDGVR